MSEKPEAPIPAKTDEPEEQTIMVCLPLADEGKGMEGGCHLERCARCDSAVLVSPESMKQAAEIGAQFVCKKCAAPEMANPNTEFGEPSAGVLRELNAAGISIGTVEELVALVAKGKAQEEF